MINILEDRKRVSQALKSMRLSKGFTVYRLCKLSGLTHSQISQIESGEKNFTIDSYLKIMKVLR